MKPQHLISVSGGKDSTACYLLAIESGRPFRAVFADTGNEHTAVHDYLADLPRLTGGPEIEIVKADFSSDLARHKAYLLKHWPDEGIPQEIVDQAASLHEPSGNPFLDLCVLKGRFPSRRAQFCTEELKTIPITTQIVLPMLKIGPVLQWIGVRAEESKRRALQPRYNRHDSGSTLWRPIFDWTVQQVWEQHTKHGIRPNPLYAMGMGRVGCMPCINCSKPELRNIGKMFPDHIERIEQWERIVGMVSKRGGSSFFAPINGDILPIREAVQWSKTSRGGRQFPMHFSEQAGSGCDSDLALCELAP